MSILVFEVSVRRAACAPSPGAGTEGHQRLETLVARAHDHAVGIGRALKRLGISWLLEDPGARRRRLWVTFARPLPARHALALARLVADDLGAPPPELVVRTFPASDAAGRRGEALLLPLGRVSGTGARARFVDQAGRTIPCGVDALLRLPRAEPRAVRDLLWRRQVEGPARTTAAHKALAGDPGAQRVLEGCSLLRALAEKAQRLGHLDGDERRTLVEVFGHLPGAPAALAALLAPAGATPSDVQRRLRRLPDFPLSCRRLQARHGRIAVEPRCACDFGALPPGCYPSPVLFALPPASVRTGLEPRRRARRPPTRESSDRALSGRDDLPTGGGVVKKPTVAAPSVGDAPPEKSPTTDAGPRILPVASPPALGANRDSPPAPDGAASGRQLQRAVAELRARFLGFTAGFGQALADLERLADLDKSP